MAEHRNIIKSDAEYTRSYDNMHGIASGMSAENVRRKFAYTENMYVDHEASEGIIESIPGFRRLYSFRERINGIFMHKLGTEAEYTVIHAGNKLYRFDSSMYDSLETLEPIAELEDVKSKSFLYGRRLYIIDGVRLIEIDEDGTVVSIEGADSEGCYVPTTYKDRQPYEDRNLLTSKFKEEISVASSEEITFGSTELIYLITSITDATCAVVGIGDRDPGPVYIPSRTTIGGKEYTVTEISQSAFRDNLTVTELITSSGLQKIGRFAFWGAKELTRVKLSTTVTTVAEYAFNGCESLEYLLLGISTSRLGQGMLVGCDALSEVSYSGSAESFLEITNAEVLGDREIVYNAQDRSVTVSLPVLSPAEMVTRVTIDGVNTGFTFLHNSSQLVLTFSDKSSIEGKRVTIYGTLFDRDTSGFLSSELSGRVTPWEAILGCRVCEVFDGRVFLSGNPSLAGAVFYTAVSADGITTPFYFGNQCYFIDGAGDWTTRALLTTEGSLAVFKNGDDGRGSIFYHTPKGEGRSRTYPISYIHGKTTAVGEAYNFLGESVFMTSLGLSKLSRASSDYMEIKCVSNDIFPMLCKEDFGNISITEWMGYLVLLAGKNMYLADGTGRFSGDSRDYDWYYVSKVGTYLYDIPVYRYSATTPEGYDEAEFPDTPATSYVCSVPTESGEVIYFQELNGKKYLVYPTEEYCSGTFFPATVAKGDGKLLFFGTECGDLCVFNNDKRGVPPDSVKNVGGFTTFDYKREMGDRIHPLFYSFAGHATRYAVSTAFDDCGFSYLEKRTVPSSLVLKLKNFSTGKLYCEVGTDNGELRSFGLTPASCFSFRDLSFRSFSTMTRERSVMSVPDRSHSWTEKQITVYADEFCSPFGVYSISYRYKIKGKIKKTTT